MVTELKDVECTKPMPSEERLPARKGITDPPARAEESLGTILLAEDDPAVRAFLASVLQQAGYHTLLAENSRQALNICLTHDGIIDALVTDVVMPEINGRELAERAKLVRPDLKLLFISGYVDRGPKEEDAAHPSSAFLQKPFTADSLLHALEAIRMSVRKPAAAYLRPSR